MNPHLRVIALLSFAVVLVFHDSLAAQEASNIADERKALAALVQEVDSAYNAQDAARLSAVFTEDANFQYSVEGLTLGGRDVIKQHFAKQFATLPPMRHVTTTGGVDEIAPGILAVDFQLDILAVDPKTGSASTLLFHYNGLSLGIRTASGWRIRLIRLYRMVSKSGA